MRKKALRVWLLLGCLIISLILSGCEKKADDSARADKRQHVSVALWGNQLMETYVPWLVKRFPNVDFDFYNVANAPAYYRFRAAHDALPDILTVRRFSLKDVEPLKEQLLDFSNTELANSFYQSYLRNYTYADATINWLPACAEVDDIIVNKTLFEEHNIPLPVDYKSFVFACREFEKLGIKGFATDTRFDYTCMEMLQGLSADKLSSDMASSWRRNYESEKTDALSEEVWLPCFEKLIAFVKETQLGSDSLNLMPVDVKKGFEKGEIAMYRGTGGELLNFGKNFERIMLPWPADNARDAFYLTYPAFQVAASARAKKDPEREKLIIEIVSAMLGEEGLSQIAPGSNLIAYNKKIKLNLLPSLKNIEEYIKENRMYIRLASSEMFAISRNVVHKIIKGELTNAREAYDEFNRQLLAVNGEAKKTVAAHIDRGHSRTFTREHGNMAASAVYNTLREEVGLDCLFGQAAIVSGDILEGDYTSRELNWIINWGEGRLARMELTGDELKSLVEYALRVKGTRESVANDSTLLVSSGFEMEITRSNGEYILKKITFDGKDADPQKKYLVGFYDSNEFSLMAGFDKVKFKPGDRKMGQMLVNRLTTGTGKLSAPTDYITLH